MNPIAEEDLAADGAPMNELIIDPTGFMLARYTFFLDAVSKEMKFTSEAESHEQHWGLIVHSKTTKDPIIAICVANEAVLVEGLKIIHSNPQSILQLNETTIICEPDNSGGIKVLQSLTITNSLFSYNIASIEYNQLDNDQLKDLLKMHNSVVRRHIDVDMAELTEEEDAHTN